jgi:serine protease Do
MPAMKRLVPLLAALALSATADPELKERLKDLHAEGQAQWIYNDISAGMAAAKKENKPLFVTFRCVPCRDCMEFDGLVAGANKELKSLAGKFVAVRQVEMKGVDLSQFQFDYDLNWAAMFLNADGTVYARYGTQSGEGSDAYNSPASLAKTMKRVLVLHAGYPGNKSQLVGKRGQAKPAKTALDLPGLPGKEKFRGPTQLSNCIHCHNIHDAEVLDAFDKGILSQDLLWRYPLPQNIGLIIDRADGRRIEGTVRGSNLAKAALPSGAELTTVNGQGITSIADIQWALHTLPADQKDIRITFRDQGNEISLSYPLEKGWRKTDLSWRGSMWSVPPRLRIWLPEPDEKERNRHKLPVGQSAVVARWINTKEEAGRIAKKAGLQTGDLIIEVDGKPVPKGGGAKFSTYVKLNYKPGQKLPLTVWRFGKRVNIELPLVK